MDNFPDPHAYVDMWHGGGRLTHGERLTPGNDRNSPKITVSAHDKWNWDIISTMNKRPKGLALSLQEQTSLHPIWTPNPQLFKSDRAEGNLI
jgi:hypothetical protein